MMVVPVLMTSCQVSEKSKTGPVPAHTATSTTASTNVAGLPAHSEVLLAKRVNRCCGVSMLQGYALARPMPALQIAPFARAASWRGVEGPARGLQQDLRKSINSSGQR